MATIATGSCTRGTIQSAQRNIGSAFSTRWALGAPCSSPLGTDTAPMVSAPASLTAGATLSARSPIPTSVSATRCWFAARRRAASSTPSTICRRYLVRIASTRARLRLLPSLFTPHRISSYPLKASDRFTRSTSSLCERRLACACCLCCSGQIARGGHRTRALLATWLMCTQRRSWPRPPGTLLTSPSKSPTFSAAFCRACGRLARRRVPPTRPVHCRGSLRWDGMR
mmetsp:Transcript_8095/g.16422  ORF Transcript_8095/g.16422 Transcript_8095/m.16422 type:complete len:227 (+) Transcript_8095:575-1255(+)